MRLLALVTQPPAYAAPSRTIAKHQDFRAGMQSAHKDRSRAAEYLVRSVTVHVSFALHMAFTCPDTDLGPAQDSIIRLHEVTPEEHLSWSSAECNRTLGCP